MDDVRVGSRTTRSVTIGDDVFVILHTLTIRNVDGECSMAILNIIITRVRMTIENTCRRVLRSRQVGERGHYIDTTRIRTDRIRQRCNVHRRVHNHLHTVARKRTVAVGGRHVIGQHYRCVAGILHILVLNVADIACRSITTRPRIEDIRRVTNRIHSRGDDHIATRANHQRVRHRHHHVGVSSHRDVRHFLLTTVGILHRQGVNALCQLVELSRISISTQCTHAVLVVVQRLTLQIVKIAEASVLDTALRTAHHNLTVVVGTSGSSGCGSTHRNISRLSHRDILRSSASECIRYRHLIISSRQTAEYQCFSIKRASGRCNGVSVFQRAARSRHQHHLTIAQALTSHRHTVRSG